LHDAIKAVVIGKRESRIAEPCGLLYEFFWTGDPVEEAIGRVAV
jgi:hypothetical protein